MTRPDLAVPLLPPLADDLLAQHAAAHESFAAGFEQAPGEVRDLFRYVQRRVLVESVANIRPVFDGRRAPRRRRFVSPSMELRVRGCSVAFRHVDSRSAMWRDGHLDALVGPDTPMVVHALAESNDPGRRETNPGLVRSTDAGFDPTESDFRPPDGTECQRLLDATVGVANDAPMSAIARAGWMCAALLAIHPFVDGNGRTARLLFHLIAGSEVPARVDWGSLEIWADARPRYVSALKQTQSASTGRYRSDCIDTAPFMEFAVEASIAGAARTADRLQALRFVWEHDWTSMSSTARILEMAVWLDGTARLSELEQLVLEPLCSSLVNRLVDLGKMVWDEAGLLRLANDHPIHEAAADM
ncbi:MAG: Fic family protein [Ilumatobacter sp.]|uniref:Fic family protein n=1 Tax=Ilumatobacter sp. TaxID=1967498 RepID=UPI00391DC08E